MVIKSKVTKVQPWKFQVGMRVFVTRYYGGPVERGVLGTLLKLRDERRGIWGLRLDKHTYACQIKEDGIIPEDAASPGTFHPLYRPGYIAEIRTLEELGRRFCVESVSSDGRVFPADGPDSLVYYPEELHLVIPCVYIQPSIKIV